MEWFFSQNLIFQAFLGGLFCWLMTTAGASFVLFMKTMNRKLMDTLLGFAAGIMIAASFWSLLAPSIELSEKAGGLPWVVPLIGFLCGGFFLWIMDKVLPHVHPNLNGASPEGVKTHWHKSILLVLAITLHNIPEGLAVGVAFGATSGGIATLSFAGAAALALGIGIQDFPEGAAVSLPLRGAGMSRKKAFFWGSASGFVEPLAAILGAWAVTAVSGILPFGLAFAAGAMIFVVIEELIPESQSAGNTDLATLGTLGGFALMMVLDVALG